MAGKRSYTGGRFGMVLDGSEMVGFVKKVSGGNIKGEVVSHNLGPDNVQKKHIATISHDPLTVEIGMGMGRGMYEWIRASFEKGHISKNGEVVACDFDYHVMSAKEFYDAHIAEVTVPALDGSSKESAYFTIKIDPERIRYRNGDGKQVMGKIGPSQKQWLCSNFRFNLGAMPCDRVAKIDSFTWKQGVIKDEVGAFREATKHPSKVEVPNLKLTISMADIEPWRQWHQSFVIDGKCTESDELSGSIEFLSANLKDTLGSIDLMNCGIISLEQEGVEANKEGVARFTVEIYVEQMKFSFNKTDA